MEFKKCERCGCFFTSNDNVCFNCMQKDKAEINKLKNYFDINTNVEVNNINFLSIETGISQKNLNRYIDNNTFNINDFLK